MSGLIDPKVVPAPPPVVGQEFQAPQQGATDPTQPPSLTRFKTPENLMADSRARAAQQMASLDSSWSDPPQVDENQPLQDALDPDLLNIDQQARLAQLQQNAGPAPSNQPPAPVIPSVEEAIMAMLKSGDPAKVAQARQFMVAMGQSTQPQQPAPSEVEAPKAVDWAARETEIAAQLAEQWKAQSKQVQRVRDELGEESVQEVYGFDPDKNPADAHMVRLMARNQILEEKHAAIEKRLEEDRARNEEMATQRQQEESLNRFEAYLQASVTDGLPIMGTNGPTGKKTTDLLPKGADGRVLPQVTDNIRRRADALAGNQNFVQELTYAEQVSGRRFSVDEKISRVLFRAIAEEVAYIRSVAPLTQPQPAPQLQPQGQPTPPRGRIPSNLVGNNQAPPMGFQTTPANGQQPQQVAPGHNRQSPAPSNAGQRMAQLMGEPVIP